MWIAALKNLSHAKPNEAKTANNQSSLITNHLEGKPNQTQFKPNTNPITEKALINISSFMTSKYEEVSRWRDKKTNPIQTQSKANFKRLLTALTIMCLTDILASIMFLCGQVVKIGKRII
jgi:hypothetical protein